MPMEKRINPPIPQREQAILAQPPIVWPEKYLTKKYTIIAILAAKSEIPRKVIMRIGFTENDVMPSRANLELIRE